MMLKKVNKKHILSLAVATVVSAGLSANASAAVNGPYLGGQIGYGNVNQGGFSKSQIDMAVGGIGATSHTSSSDTGVAGRVFGGYQFNPYLAAEMGYSKFSDATAKASATLDGSSLTERGTIKTYAVDLVGKAILPLPNCFNVYGKAGVAYLSETADVSVTLKDPTEGTLRAKGSDTDHHLYPTYGAGIGYDVTKNLVADVSWNHIQKTGKSNLANTDLYAVGLAYNFG